MWQMSNDLFDGNDVEVDRILYSKKHLDFRHPGN
jgi:hypothetical protein